MQPKITQQHALENIFQNVIDIINEGRTRTKVSREFSSFCNDMLVDHDILIMHSEVRTWKSTSKHICHIRILKIPQVTLISK